MVEFISIFKKYILFHIRIIHKVYNKLNEQFNGNLFCLFFNIKSKLTQNDVVFNYNKVNLSYIARSKKYKRFFYAKKQNIMAYSKGIRERGKDLGNVYMLNSIDFKSGDLVIDCGANIGDLEIYFKERKLDINYLAFEPSPLEFKCLNNNLLLQNSKCFNYALFDKEDIIKFYISSEFGDSSLIEPKKFTKEINIQTKRFDSIFKELELTKIKLLKLEAEGAEPEILLGCGNTLSQVEYITADLGFERGVKQESTLPEVSNILIKQGFEMIDFMYPRIVGLFKNKKYS